MMVTTSRQRITVLFAAVLILCTVGAAVVSHRLDALSGDSLQEVLWIPSPKILKRLSLGYDGLLADLYWTRVVQYFGGKHYMGALHYKLLAPLLDITTELDPHLLVAYQFGSVFLAQAPPEGAGEPDNAVALVERGIRENPTTWKLYFNLGFIHYSERHDLAAAAQAFERGSRVPGAHPSLKVLAAAMEQGAGNLNTARYLWSRIYETTDNRMIRDNAVKRLRALQVDEDITVLEAVVRQYKEVSGHFPANWAELRATGWRGRNVDPLGYPYKLEAEGHVRVQDPDRLPFITKGLPPGREPQVLGPAPSAAQR